VELLQDATFEIAPVTPHQADEMISRTRLNQLISGYRGAAPADRAALAATLARLSDIAVAYRDELDAMDLNPVSIQPAGKGAIVLDALIIPKAKNIPETK
jgi:hypothetical protein